MSRSSPGPGGREAIIAALQNVLEDEHDVVLGYLHGSLARDEAHVGDADVGLLLEGDPSNEECLDRELALEQSINESVQGLPIDVRILNHAPVTFRFAVIRDGHVLLSRSPRTRGDFEEGTLALYLDYKHHLDTYRREALGLGT